jgi:ABC-2 type transport system permease protein
MSKRHNNPDLLRELIRTDFKLRYNNSLLGVLWVVMKPLLSFLVLFFIFGAFKTGFENQNFAANLLIGIIVFNFIQEGTTFGMSSLLKMADIILKINFPRELAVLSSVFISLLNFFINLVVILIITLLVSFVPDIRGIPYFIGIMFVLFVTVYSISLFLSIIVIRVRDLENIILVLFQMLFWGSAIFYDLNALSGTVGDLVRLNPVAILIDASRKALINGEYTHLDVFALMVVVSALLFIAGRVFFGRNVKRIAEYF